MIVPVELRDQREKNCEMIFCWEGSKWAREAMKRNEPATFKRENDNETAIEFEAGAQLEGSVGSIGSVGCGDPDLTLNTDRGKNMMCSA